MSQAIIVVPCYNEALRLDVHMFREFAREHRDQRFLFVNDGSTDADPGGARGPPGSDPDCFAICDLPRTWARPRPSAGVCCGHSRPLPSTWDTGMPISRPPWMPSSPSAPPGLEARHRHGVRRPGQPSRPLRERSSLRHYLGRIFATAASLALGIGFYDTQCGAKLFRASHELMSLFQGPFATRWLFDVEIIARLIAARRGTDRPRVDEIVYEFPLHEWHDIAGSKVKPRDFVKAFFELAEIAWRYGRMPRPASEPAHGRSSAGSCDRGPGPGPLPSVR